MRSEESESDDDCDFKFDYNSHDKFECGKKGNN